VPNVSGCLRRLDSPGALLHHDTMGNVAHDQNGGRQVEMLAPGPGHSAPGAIRLIRPDGSLDPGGIAAGFALPGAETLLSAYRRMVIGRRFDVQITALTRQGRLATYPSSQGQEACEIAAVAVLADDDWLFPTYRDTVAVLTRGVEPSAILSFFRGDWHSGYDPYEHRIAPQATPLATQALHAVGLATAAKLKHERTVALAMLGDGATSEGDAHEAFNFAAVWQAPAVFLVQNNQYAISVPYAKQSRAASLADKGVGYGMPGFCVDGNDVAAMLAVLSAAVERARDGGGPTLVEGMTYRMEAHTNSDDPTRYRTSEEVERWRAADPISRLETYLTREGVLTTDARNRIAEEAEALASRTRDAMNETPELDPLELFDHVYVEQRPALEEQRAFLAAELASIDTEGDR
jgi:pyruvate dehydrogenase E1 component alpha subunit